MQDDPVPSYLQQQENPSWSGALNNMIRALLAGSSQQKQTQPLPGPTSPPSSLLNVLEAGNWPPYDMSPTPIQHLDNPWGKPKTDPTVSALFNPVPQQ